MSRRTVSRTSARSIAAVAAAVLVTGLAFAAPAAADQQTTVAVGDVTVAETDTGTAAAVFTVTLTQSSPNPTTVAYYTADGSARAPGDYTPTAGQLVFAPGLTSKTVTVPVVGDTRYEGDETFSLIVSSPSGALVPDNTGSATIVDDDPLPYVSVGDTSVVEGDSGTVDAVFPVTLDRASVDPVKVRYVTSTGSANGADFQYIKGTLTIPAGQTSATVAVPVDGDTLDEGTSEYFYLGLSQPSGAAVFGNAAIGTIVDDDGTPLLSVTDSAVVEGNTGTKNMTFTVKLSGASPNQVVASYATNDGSATVADYTPTFGTLTFAPGEVSKTVTVPVLGDTLDEGTAEYFNLALQAVSGADVSDGSAYGEIVDDDPTASNVSFLTVDTTTVKEGDTGKATATFTVLLQPASASAVTVNYATSPSSASAGTDYTTKTGTLTIPAGSTKATVQVAVLGDDLIEGDEQFSLNLSGAVNATIDDGSAYCVIFDDDVAPVVSVSDTTVAEGNTGTADAAFEISLSAPSPVTSSVVYTTGNSSASAPADYTTVSGTAVFQPGQTSKIVHIPVIGDRVDENDEQFYVYLSSPSNAVVTDNYGYGIILDDDRAPGISVDDPSIYEGTSGTAKAVFTVTLSAASANTVTVNYGTGNGSAVAPDDYTAVSGTVTFSPGQTSKAVAVTVNSDTVDEGSEYLYLNLNSPSNANLVDSYGLLYILDDDTNPGISIDDASLFEPDSGTAAVTFDVTLSAASANPVTVNYYTGDGSAVSSSDYTAVNGTLTFAPGQTAETVTVNVAGDTIHENDEWFYVNLTAPVSAYILDNTGYGTIIDEDPTSNLTVDETGVIEGNSGSRNGTFTVSLQPASPNQVTVSYATADGSATAADGDYTTTTGSLTFAPGQTSKTVTVPVKGDTVDENNEYFGLNLSSAVNADILDGNGYVTIFDDDPSGSGTVLSVNDATVLEKNSGTGNEVFAVKLSPAPTSKVTVNYRTSDGSAVANQDYVPQAGTLTFAAGQTTATVTVPITGDTLDENDESFSLQLFSLTGPASFGESSAYGVILDNDVSPLVAVGDTTVSEGGPGRSVDAAFTVRLLQPSPQPVWVDWNTRDGSAVAPGDYLDDDGTLYFAPGQTSQVVHVTVYGDDVVEGDESFHLDLSSPVGASYGTSETTGEGVILDNDAYSVLGSVTNPAGTGVGGTKLTLTGNSLPAQSVTSTSTGAYSFVDVPDGKYTITPTATDRVFTPATFSVVVRGGSLTGYTFLSMKAPSVSGKVVGTDGKGVPGVTVTRSGNSQPDATTTTNNLGYYAFAPNPTGTYTITPSGGTSSPASTSVTLTATSAVTANFTQS